MWRGGNVFNDHTRNLFILWMACLCQCAVADIPSVQLRDAATSVKRHSLAAGKARTAIVWPSPGLKERSVESSGERSNVACVYAIIQAIYALQRVPAFSACILSVILCLYGINTPRVAVFSVALTHNVFPPSLRH